VNREDGGSAFPFEGGANNGNSPEGGMSLRDWFAANANDNDIQSIPSIAWVGEECIHFDRSERRYKFADAMLAARKKDT
jgi:hypothetical protein